MSQPALWPAGSRCRQWPFLCGRTPFITPDPPATMRVTALVLATAATAAAFSTPSTPTARVAHVRWNFSDIWANQKTCDTCLCWGVSSSKVQALQMVGAMVSWLELEIPDWMLAGPESILSHRQAIGIALGVVALYLVADPSLKARYAIRRVRCSIISFFSLHFLCSRSPLGDSTLFCLLVVAIL